MLRTNVYIDGFNLYYGCLKGTAFRWLDLGVLARMLLPKGHELHRIRYYTARVASMRDNQHAPKRQALYLRALTTIPNLSITFGHFLTSTTMLPLAEPAARGIRFARVIKTEEKGSDVNLASHLLLDAFREDCGAALVVSNDSDLREPIRIVRREFGLHVGLASPHPRPSRVLAVEVDWVRPIWPGTLKRSLFPASLRDARGTFCKPARW